mmetsp:Transcript_36098/g.56379  ORF Transcript_36098/g.56379 Transcript_36098/m.56379 type:complete len:82 (+) Transcript_36098:1453-1698(+)
MKRPSSLLLPSPSGPHPLSSLTPLFHLGPQALRPSLSAPQSDCTEYNGKLLKCELDFLLFGTPQPLKPSAPQNTQSGGGER